VLAALAAHREGRFTVLPLPEEPDVVPRSQTRGRAVTQSRREVRKLEQVGVIEEVGRLRKTEIYAVADNEVAERALALPDALIAQLGKYKRES
jgi:hypothetical protein